MRNPLWNRNELILALDLYFRLDYGQMHSRNKEVIKLSDFLRIMGQSLFISIPESYRSAGSVSRKLGNFMRFDEKYISENRTGLIAGSKLEENIWNEFADNKVKLASVATGLRNQIIKSLVSDRKQRFIKWLSVVGKPDGTDYQERTIETYASQVEKSIVNEFQLYIDVTGGLYCITEISELLQIEKILKEAEDSKKRRDLRSAFQNYIRFVKDQFEFNDSFEIGEEAESKTEGGKKVYISKKAERDNGLRNKAIAIHGTSCKACGFDFGLFYGDWGQDFIEVHHLIPLGGKESKKRKTNPKTDLTVLCANCHRMIHRKKKNVLSLDELRLKITVKNS